MHTATYPDEAPAQEPQPAQPPPLLALLKANSDELRRMATRCIQLAELNETAIARLESPMVAKPTTDPPLQVRPDLATPPIAHAQAPKHICPGGQRP